MIDIASRLQAVQGRIRIAAEAARRRPEEVRLIAVSKTFPAQAIREAHLAGQDAFGENYLQDARSKIEALRDLKLEWHFLGPVQSNKTRLIAQYFSWVHSVDNLKHAQRLSDARPDDLPPLQICIQVNISGEETKRGCEPDRLGELATAAHGLRRLQLRGLMSIPAPTDDMKAQCDSFAQLRRMKDQLVAEGLDLDTLSMGMSDDLEAAISEGSTMVRVGRAIFGPRQTPA
jgi:pyridoxal phosphate enzyme (YggS family)